MVNKACIDGKIIEVVYSNFDIYKKGFMKLHLENMEKRLEQGKIDEDYFEIKALELKEYIFEKKAVLFLYIIEDEVKGCIWAYPKKYLDEKRLFVQLLQVNSKYRSLGIGQKLLEVLESYAKKNDYDAIDLITSTDNEGALRFYKREGFRTERIQLLKEID